MFTPPTPCAPTSQTPSDLSYLYWAISSSLGSPLSIFNRGSTSSYLVHILIITWPLGMPCFLSRPWELWAEENHCFTFHTSNAKTMTDLQESVLCVPPHVWVCARFKLLTSMNHRTGKLFLPCESTIIPSRNKEKRAVWECLRQRYPSLNQGLEDMRYSNQIASLSEEDIWQEESWVLLGDFHSVSGPLFPYF